MRDTAGYAYLYKKTVRLTKGKPQLVLEHSLKNTGTKVIETSVYEHNFYMIDGKPAGPDYTVKFPFDVTATADLKGMAETRGKEFTYLKELPKGPSVYTALEGFGAYAEGLRHPRGERRGASRRPPDFGPARSPNWSSGPFAPPSVPKPISTCASSPARNSPGASPTIFILFPNREPNKL